MYAFATPSFKANKNQTMYSFHCVKTSISRYYAVLKKPMHQGQASLAFVAIDRAAPPRDLCAVKLQTWTQTIDARLNAGACAHHEVFLWNRGEHSMRTGHDCFVTGTTL